MTFERMGTVDNDLAMIKPKLTGTDDDGNPFVVTADAAVQDGRNIAPRAAEQCRSRHDAEGCGWLNATAQAGLLDANAKKLTLTGAISRSIPTAATNCTPTASNVDLANGLVARRPPGAPGKGRSARSRADRFASIARTERILLTGNVHMTVFASGMSKNSKGTKRK